MDILSQIKLLKEKILETPPQVLRILIEEKISTEDADRWGLLERIILEKKD